LAHSHVSLYHKTHACATVFYIFAFETWEMQVYGFFRAGKYDIMDTVLDPKEPAADENISDLLQPHRRYEKSGGNPVPGMGHFSGAH